jgi:hypothetical protein
LFQLDAITTFIVLCHRREITYHINFEENCLGKLAWELGKQRSDHLAWPTPKRQGKILLVRNFIELSKKTLDDEFAKNKNLSVPGCGEIYDDKFDTSRREFCLEVVFIVDFTYTHDAVFRINFNSALTIKG